MSCYNIKSVLILSFLPAVMLGEANAFVPLLSGSILSYLINNLILVLPSLSNLEALHYQSALKHTQA